jgi:phosphatidylglycerol phospholipase C
LCTSLSLIESAAHFLRARTRVGQNGREFPQVIAHRGYNAKFPENTMAAFKAAVEVGAHALETDVHLTSDGVVVLSHVRNYPDISLEPK